MALLNHRVGEGLAALLEMEIADSGVALASMAALIQTAAQYFRIDSVERGKRRCWLRWQGC